MINFVLDVGNAVRADGLNGLARPDPLLTVKPEILLANALDEEAFRGVRRILARDLDILDDLTIILAGTESTILDGDRTDRALEKHGAAVVRMSAR